MRRILDFLAKDGAFLYEKKGFKLVDSEYCDMFGGTGRITLSNGIVDLVFWLDRDRLLMELRITGRKSPHSWFSLDILHELITGQSCESAQVDNSSLAFLVGHLDDIVSRFRRGDGKEAEAACRVLESKRARQMFAPPQ